MNAKKYLGIRKNAWAIQQLMDIIGVPSVCRKLFIEKVDDLAAAKIATPEYISHVDPQLLNSLSKTISELKDEIQERRRILRFIETHTVRSRNREASLIHATDKIRKTWKSANACILVDVIDEPLRKFIGEEISGYYVKVPIYWFKSVHQNKISVVQGGDGPRFILSAKRYPLKRLEEDGFKVYKVRALKYRKRTAEVNDEYVMYYSPDDTTNVTAVHQNFGRCESLIQRRIRDTVDRTLGGL